MCPSIEILRPFPRPSCSLFILILSLTACRVPAQSAGPCEELLDCCDSLSATSAANCEESYERFHNESGADLQCIETLRSIQDVGFCEEQTTNPSGSDPLGSDPDAGFSNSEDSDQACSDQVDNDQDGYTDCDDYDCSRNDSIAVCDSERPAENSNASCTDSQDNDGDGDVDCDDYDCSQSPGVTVCSDTTNVTLTETGAFIDPFDDEYLTAVTTIDLHPNASSLLIGGNVMSSWGGALHFSDGRLQIKATDSALSNRGSVLPFPQSLTSAKWNTQGTRFAIGLHGTGEVAVHAANASGESSELYRSGTCHDGEVNAVAWHPNADVFYSVGGASFSAGAAPDICRYSQSGATYDYTRFSSASIFSFTDVAVSSSGSEIYVAGGTGLLTRSGSDLSFRHASVVDQEDSHRLVDVMHDEQLAVVAGSVLNFIGPRFDPATANNNQIIGAAFLEPITAIVAHPTLPMIAVGTEAGFLAIISQKTVTRLATAFAHDGPIYALEWSEAGDQLYTGGLYPALKTWAVSIATD